MNKKGAELKSIFFSVVILGLVITAFVSILANMGSEYGTSLDIDLSDYQKNSEVQVVAESQQGQLTPQDSTFSEAFENNVFKAGYGIVASTFSSFAIAFDMIEATSDRFGIPSYIGLAITLLITFTLIYTIISIVFRLGRTSA